MKLPNYIIYLSVFLISPTVLKAEQISGVIKNGKDEVTYKVDTKTGEYFLDYEKTFNPKIKISSNEEQKLNCERERIYAETSKGSLEASFYVRKDKPIRLSLSISDVDLSENEIETHIKDELQKRSLKHSNLKNMTKYYFMNSTYQYEWQDTSIGMKGKSNLTATAQEHLRKVLGASELYELINSGGRAEFSTTLHYLVCDLIDENFKLYLTAEVETEKAKIVKSVLTQNELGRLNDSLLSKKQYLVSAQKNYGGSFMDAEKSKIVNSAVVLGYELSSMGLSLAKMEKHAVQLVFTKMFDWENYLPRKASPSDLSDIENFLTSEELSAAGKINFVNKQLKLEVVP